MPEVMCKGKQSFANAGSYLHSLGLICKRRGAGFGQLMYGSLFKKWDPL